MKIIISLKRICKHCKIIYRNKRLRRLCVVRKHKAHQR